jgi:hypothetical protein
MPNETETMQWQARLRDLAVRLMQADSRPGNLARLCEMLEQSVANPTDDPTLAAYERPQEINESERDRTSSLSASIRRCMAPRGRSDGVNQSGP